MSAVDEFTCRVEVTGVGCRLSDHMQQDFAQVVVARVDWRDSKGLNQWESTALELAEEQSQLG